MNKKIVLALVVSVFSASFAEAWFDNTKKKLKKAGSAVASGAKKAGKGAYKAGKSAYDHKDDIRKGVSNAKKGIDSAHDTVDKANSLKDKANNWRGNNQTQVNVS